MKVTAVMATCGRHFCAERSLSLFLSQTYSNKHLLIYQNSEVYQKLDKNVDTRLVSLINNHIDKTTLKPYSSLGDIYLDAIQCIPSDTDIVIFWDDDDLFLIDHIEEGVKGLIRGGKSAYKPAQSYFLSHDNSLTKQVNTFEPSLFVRVEHIINKGFSRTTTDQHLQWLDPLIFANDIFVDPQGKPTLIYNWGDHFYIYKTSGNPQDQSNFNEYRRNSVQHGDHIISPMDISKLLCKISSVV